METTATKLAKAPSVGRRIDSTLALVDCADRARQDLLACWLTRSGYEVREGSASDVLAAEPDGGATRVLLTDRFGPGRSAKATILELKAMRPRLRVVVIGDGDEFETAQLSLARAAGADATLPSPLVRERVLELLDRWS